MKLFLPSIMCKRFWWMYSVQLDQGIACTAWHCLAGQLVCFTLQSLCIHQSILLPLVSFNTFFLFLVLLLIPYLSILSAISKLYLCFTLSEQQHSLNVLIFAYGVHALFSLCSKGRGVGHPGGIPLYIYTLQHTRFLLFMHIVCYIYNTYNNYNKYTNFYGLTGL